MFFSKKLNRFKDINHCFFSRNGGFSKGIYKSLNCGSGSKDNKINVSNNLSFVATKMRVKKKNLILMRQTHSSNVIEIIKKNYKSKVNSDAIITKLKAFALAVVTADCVPILIYDKKNKIIGCIHAGWRGALAGIIKNTVKKMRKIGSNGKLFAAVGPCIGKKNYEVDINFYRSFLISSNKNIKYFSYKNKQKKLFNLRKYVTDKLLELNINVDQVNRDTFNEKKNFFSYRRSSKLKQTDYGRCISVISLV
tara:strand:+ start:199 stop:951 length:753 start_codon:yes stop_codon:yes gene_type:complete